MPGLRGVNLGGWLVLERWMTPSLFDGTDAHDEYTFMSTPDAAAKLDAHRRTFITEDDFIWLAANGIDAVRIPVGYWVLEGDGPYLPAAEYLDRAFEWAAAHGITVLLDLHGLPGSQNGNDHSGRIGKVEWTDHVDEALDRLAAIAARYAGHPALWGVQIINEPNPAALQLALRRYYSRAYRRLSNILPGRIRIVYSDAWSPRLLAFALPFARRAVMDVHLYHMATLGAKKHDLDWFYRKLRRRARMLRRISRIRPLIIGEWSGVISHETVGHLPKSEQDELFAAYVALERELYADFADWFYWSYKTEEPSHWNYRAMVGRGLVASE